MPRQLTAIMFADMVGYTALMQEDEKRAKLLRDRQREVLEERVAEFGGEIVQYYGDGALCGFQSAIQAVECAVAIQVDLREEPPVAVRIGLHLGDVAFDKTGVYGDGVNVAARIESLSVAGGVLVSGKIAEEVKNHPEIATEFLAEVALKNVKEPQRVFAVANADLAKPGPKELKGWPRAGRKRVGGAGWVKWAVGAVAIAGAAGIYAITGDGGSDAEELTSTPLTQERIAVLPFRHVGMGNEKDLGGVVAIQLRGLLAGGGFLPVDHRAAESFFEELVGEGVTGRPAYERVADASEADLVLHGDVATAPGGGLTVNAYLFDRRAPEIDTQISQIGTEEGFNTLVRELAAKLLRARSGADASLLGDLLSESIDALLAFDGGDRQFKVGNYVRAKELLKEAVSYDPNLTIAHYRLSQAQTWAWEFEDARTSVNHAWGLRSGLTPLNQRLLDAWRSFLISQPEIAERSYGTLYEEHPGSSEVLAGLGSVLAYYNSLRGRPSAEAIDLFEAVLGVDATYGEARYHVLDHAAKTRDQDLFEEWVEGLAPDGPQTLPFAVVRAIAFGDADDQGEAFRRLEGAGTDPLVFAAGRVAVTLHNFPAAERIGQLLLRARGSGDHIPAGNGLLAALAFAQGKWTETGQHLDETAVEEPEWAMEMRALFSVFLSSVSDSIVSTAEMMSLAESIEAWEPEEFVEFSYRNLFGPHSQKHQELRLYLLGLINVRLDEVDMARENSAAVGSYGRTPETRGFTNALSLSVDAHIAQAEGNLEAALTDLESQAYYPPFEFISASPFFSRALDRWLRGELLRGLDRPEDALSWYNTLSDGWGEFLFAGPAHLRQAEIYTNLDSTSAALHHYEEFIRLWDDADEELQPLVKRARAAQEALASGGE